MSNEAWRNSILLLIIVLCTITIIWTNYIFLNKFSTIINNSIIQNEYKKIWWKENYIILQELQKRELLWYINKLKDEKPELIKEILELNEKWNEYKVLSNNIIFDLKKDSYIKWNTEALISIIEFSDLECDFCIKDYNENNISQLIESTGSSINYIYKNFPLPYHKNSQIEAEASLCVKKISWWQKYLEYIDNIFSTTKWWWEWYNLEKLVSLAIKLWIDENLFKNCIEKSETKEQVEREFEQWKMLWINLVPSKLIINNETWQYKIISEIVSYEKLKETIETLK